MSDDFTRDSVEANGLEFTFLTAGSGPLALCLHGFPDSPYGYRTLIPALADAGYRVVVPWMRGYAPTAIPDSGHYQTGALAKDANALHDALGGDSDAVLIGHDWGATAVYPAVNNEPERWRAMVAAAVPHPGSLATGFLQYAQLRKSWYMFFFQNPLADMVVGMDDFAFIDGLWADWSPGFDARDDVGHVKAALADPANLTAALGYYRAAIGNVNTDPELDTYQTRGGEPVTIPALYLHGVSDGCMGVDFADQCGAFLDHPDSRVEVVRGAGHFLFLEQPEVTNLLVTEFLATAGVAS